MKDNFILNLARPTPGDLDFYKRWEQLGTVFSEQSLDELKKVNVLIVDQWIDVTPEMLRRLPSVKYICSATTGHTHLKFDHKKYQVITLKNDPRLSGVRSVAEFTMKQILNIMRPENKTGNTLAGKTMGIIGYGRIGKQVTDLCKAFKMITLWYDKDQTISFLENIFKVSDVISIHLDENQSTKGFIDRKLISMMKPSAYLINTARPSIINEFALIEALKEKKIAGAMSDFNLSLPTKDVPGLIITNHIAGRTLEDRVFTDKLILEKLKFILGIYDKKMFKN